MDPRRRQSSMDGFITRKPRNVAAWQLKAKERPLTVSNAPYTSPEKNQVVIKVIDIAVNPIDWILQDQDIFGLKYPTVFGSDVAGEIAELGDSVDEFHVGQRVIAHATGRDHSHGAFQKYVVAEKNAIAELPWKIGTSSGVVLPLGISTASAGLFQEDFLNLPLPSEKPDSLKRTVLIWGGSSSVGACAIQLAVASGSDVYTTCSPKNFDFVKNLGAKEAFDYRDEDVEDNIVKALGGHTVLGAYHAVGNEDTIRLCARILDRSKGKAILASTRGAPKDGIPSSVRTVSISATSIFENDVGPYIWRKFLPKALDKGQLIPAPDPLVVGEQLRSVQLGLDKQKAGVSAAKVVVTSIDS